MNSYASGEEFVRLLSAFRPGTFESRFAAQVRRLGLDEAMDAAELGTLLQAAFRARLCTIAINGLGGCKGVIRPENERNRIRLEQEFMAAYEQAVTSGGWQSLEQTQRDEASRVFFAVEVTEAHLAHAAE